MKLDELLRQAYRNETEEWEIPERTKGAVLDKIRSYPYRRSKQKKWMIAALLTTVLIVPTGAYAGYTYLADDIYGSQENIAIMGGTPEEYTRLEAKLQMAKAHFNQEEFVQYMDLLKQLGHLAIEHSDEQGRMYPEQWSDSDQKQYAFLASELEPLFEKLEAISSADSPKSLLDPDQFWNEQLAQAEKTFNKEQKAEFKLLYEQMKQYEDQVTDKDGVIHEQRLSAKQKNELDRIREKLYSFLEKLGLEIRESSKSE
ncbi:DUF3600 domain-containing protein [Paenibacillus sp. ACRRY]|uniref:DUF3600 domain-containing protein n=1 Tax=Paenibacillus sp. ACRRY TaxID=2918208 RepID=UPI001EF5847D|nr:DUF3600 domain-containing protein [Paenibacillus sp. ACRRY]MCG7385248.1 DUF3600 domain-containing protein [Paenibacillus sp. ACRRY]